MAEYYPFETKPNACLVCRRDVEQPVQLVEALEAAPRLITTAIEPRRGTKNPGWLPEEVAAHLADLEVYRGMRIRRILVEDNPQIDSIDQDAWAAALHYGERDTDRALDTFAINRHTNLEIVRLAGDAALGRPYQSFAGPMTLLSLLEHTSHHDLAHLTQIRGD